jgi:hypothetical protein
MNNLDQTLNRLFRAAKGAPARGGDAFAPSAPFGFPARTVARWLAEGRRPAWMAPLRWGVICASLALMVSIALHADLFEEEWAPTLAVLPSTSEIALAE